MDQRCHTFSFGHYHQAPGALCGILYILVLSLVLFMQSLYPLSNLGNFSFTCYYKDCIKKDKRQEQDIQYIIIMMHQALDA